MAGEVGGNGGGSGGQYDAPSVNNHRVKFLCSHGGKILPRPADGHLKYIGGETRVIALSRHVTFSELMKKMGALYDGDMVLKYQLITEDLDTLVSVRSDEDLKHMLDEYDRQESEGSPRLRTFLFPSKPIMTENQTPSLEHHILEQRYIDAINGIIRSTPKMQPQQQQMLPPAMIMASSPMGSFSISSACSSPKSSSPEHHAAVVGDMSAMGSHRFTVPPPMHKVHSSPSICSSFNHQQNQAHGRHHYHNNYHPNHHHRAHQSSFGARAHHRGIRTPPPLSSPGRSESGSGIRSLMMMGTTSTSGHAQNHYNNYGPSSSSPKSSLQRLSSGGGGGGGGGGGCCSKCDDCPPYACNRNVDKAESLPRSPR